MEPIEQLIEENANLIYSIANKFRNCGCDMDDLKQAGRVGFIEAYNHFDESFNVKFTTYAYMSIYGKIREFATQSKGIKVSRELTKLYYKIEKVRLILTQQLMREPLPFELAEMLGIDEEIIVQSLLSKNNLTSIDETVGNEENDLTLHEVIASPSFDIDQKIMLHEALDKLPKEEYELVRKRYFDELTQSELAQINGTSQVQISRQEQKVMKKLRTYMMN